MEVNNLYLLNNSSLNDINGWDKKLSPVVHSVFKKTNAPEPEWLVGSSKLGKNPIGLFYTNNISASAGTSVFPKEAMLRTIGETIERYSSTNSHLIDKIYPLKVNEKLGFVRCGDFEKTAQSYKRNGLSKEVEHSQVIRLIDDEFEYLPFEYVHLGFMRYQSRFMHTTPISTGCAFYYNTHIAIWKGICEVVERDAMMRMWHTMTPAIPISTKNIKDYSVFTRIKRIRDAGLKLYLFEISSVVDLPVVYAIVEGMEYPYNCVGASCSENILNAINKAIDEAISIRIMAIWNRYNVQQHFDYIDFYWLDKLEKHMDLYANWKDTPAFNFLKKSNKKEIDISELIANNNYIKAPNNYEELKDIARAFKRQDFDIYWKDITIEEVKKFGFVTKVVIPQMIPLSQAFECRWLEPFTNNFYNGTLNPFPHPFS